MSPKHLFITFGIIGILMLAACGASAAPAPTSAPTTNQPSVAPIATGAAAPTTESSSNTVNDLATSVASVKNPPTVAPSGKITPAAKVTFTRKFHFGSLNGTLLGWQIVPGDGVTCATINDENLALDVKLENTAPADYSISGDYIKVLDADGTAPDTLAQGSMGTGQGGSESGVTVPADGTLEQVWCTGLSEKDDPNKLSLVLGAQEVQQVRVPLAPQGPADMGGYVEMAFNKNITFKDAAFTLPKIILTTGVWSDQGDMGQVENGKLWLLIPTQVNNLKNPNLFVEQTDIMLDVEGQTIAPALSFSKYYQAAPYGLQKGLTAEGAILFAIPKETQQATLHFKSGDSTYPDDVSVPLTIPRLKSANSVNE